MAEALAAADIEIVDLATMPYLSTGIPWWLKVGLAMVLGLVVGTVLCLLLELKNHSIRAPEEIEEVLHLRGLGVIPPVQEAIAGEEAFLLARASGGSNVRSVSDPGVVADSTVCPSAGTEAFRLLYSSLTINWGDRQRTILVTSVMPREGKTLVAANLAVTFSREGARVLLVDCDLRRPRLHQIFHLSRAPGLVELLQPSDNQESEAELAKEEGLPLEHAFSMVPNLARPEAVVDAPIDTARGPNGRGHSPVLPRREAQRLTRVLNIRETRNRNLWVLPCGAVEEVRSPTVKATGMRALLAQVANDFDVIILDTAPALVSADAVILAPVVDDVLLVICAGHTDREAADLAQQQLSDAGGNVVGAVLNDPEGKAGRDRPLYYQEHGYPVSTD
jgi:Mrp family chromosome partitioning ATPase